MIRLTEVNVATPEGKRALALNPAAVEAVAPDDDGMKLTGVSGTIYQVAQSFEAVVTGLERATAGAADATPGLRPALMSVTEAAVRLGINRPSVYRLIRRGALPALKVGGHWRLRRAAVEEYIARRGEKGDGG